MIFKAKQLIYTVNQADYAGNFILNLFLCHEDMRVILVEAANTHQTMQCAALFVSVYQTDFSHTHRQVSVGVHILLINQHTAGAVHGFYRIILAVDHCCIHVILVVFPVTGSVPKLSVQNDGCGNFHIACFFVDFSPVVQQCVFQHHALRQEEGETGAFIQQCEQLQLLAQFSVVTLLCFLHHCQICVQLGCLGVSSPVNSGKHFVLFGASPVSPCNRGQLDCLHCLCAHQVRACAQVCEVSLLVEGDNCILRQILNQLYLVGFFSFFHIFDCLCSGQFKSFNRNVLFCDFLHFNFQCFQFFLCEGLFSVEVIIEAVCNGRADCNLCFGIQTLYCLCQNMRCCVAECHFPCFILKCANRNLCILVHNKT